MAAVANRDVDEGPRHSSAEIVQVGPPKIAIRQAQIVPVSDLGGQIDYPSDNRLYFSDTRLISAWAIYSNGEFLGRSERRCYQLRRRAHLPR